MWMMLQQVEADDYVIATGRVTSVLEFRRMAFAHVGLNAEEHIEVDANFLRPAGVARGDGSGDGGGGYGSRAPGLQGRHRRPGLTGRTCRRHWPPIGAGREGAVPVIDSRASRRSPSGATMLAARLLARWRPRAAPREAIPATFFATSSLLAAAAILRVERHHRDSRDCDRTGFSLILRRVETRAKR